MPKLYFPPKIVEKMTELSLKEVDITEVLSSGEYRKEFNGADAYSKKYHYFGYEIGFWYKVNQETGEYVVTRVWKRDCR